METTKWARITGFTDYEVSNQGDVYNKRADLFCSASAGTGGHLRVNLSGYRQMHTRSVARLVADAFVPKHEQEGFNTPMHLDADHSNCRADNLVWRPRWYVMKWTQEWESGILRNGDFTHNGVHNLTRGRRYASILQAAQTDGVLPSHILEACQYLEPVMMLNYIYEFLNGASFEGR